jgi:hypothetical protein
VKEYTEVAGLEGINQHADRGWEVVSSVREQFEETDINHGKSVWMDWVALMGREKPPVTQHYDPDTGEPVDLGVQEEEDHEDT